MQNSNDMPSVKFVVLHTLYALRHESPTHSITKIVHLINEFDTPCVPAAMKNQNSLILN